MPCFFSWVFGPSSTLFLSHIFFLLENGQKKKKHTYSILLPSFSIFFPFLFLLSFFFCFFARGKDDVLQSLT